jgi:hypothetical protein
MTTNVQQTEHQSAAGTPRRYRLTRDQAVWERETFEVEVPADVEDPEEWLREKLEENDPLVLGEASIEILDHSVENIDTVIEVEQLDPVDKSTDRAFRPRGA